MKALGFAILSASLVIGTARAQTTCYPNMYGGLTCNNGISTMPHRYDGGVDIDDSGAKNEANFQHLMDQNRQELKNNPLFNPYGGYNPQNPFGH